MLISPAWVYGSLIIHTDSGGYAFSSDTWPTGRLKVQDVLQALCGEPDERGYYVFHESHHWLEEHLGAVARLSAKDVGLLAIADLAGIRGDDEVQFSRQAAASLAVVIFEKAFNASRQDAVLMVHLNLSPRDVVAGKSEK